MKQFICITLFIFSLSNFIFGTLKITPQAGFGSSLHKNSNKIFNGDENSIPRYNFNVAVDKSFHKNIDLGINLILLSRMGFKNKEKFLESFQLVQRSLMLKI